MQGQCKLKAESSLYADAQPVLAISSAKLGVINHENKKNGNARLADTLHFHYAILEGNLERLFSGFGLLILHPSIQLIFCREQSYKVRLVFL